MDKKVELLKMQRIALAFLLVAFGLLILAIVFEIGWLKAMSEAGLVGGIADWFAVVALFRHPLGIRQIPHTAIIPKQKDVIAKNLANFIKVEFFNKENLRKSQFLQSIQIKKLILGFLEGKFDSYSLQSMLLSLENKIPDFKEKILKEEFELFGNINFAYLIASALASIKDSSQYNEIIDNLLNFAEEKLRENESKIKGELVGDSWIKKAVSALTDYDSKIIQGIREKIRSYKNHNSTDRKELDTLLDQNIQKLFRDEETIKNINSKIIAILNSGTSTQIIDAALDYIVQNKILSSSLRGFIDKQLRALIANEKKMNAIDRWVKNKIIHIIGDYSENIAGFIEQTIQSWDAKEISEKLELEVGKDLQYIRINGMVVGAMIGGMIYFVEYLGACIL